MSNHAVSTISNHSSLQNDDDDLILNEVITSNGNDNRSPRAISSSNHYKCRICNEIDVLTDDLYISGRIKQYMSSYLCVGCTKEVNK